MAPPGRSDYQPAPDPEDREVPLPRLGPVGFLDHARAHIADRPQPEGLEMAERGPDLGRRPLDDTRVARWEIRPDDRRPARIQARAEALVHERERRLDADAGG